jgi:protein TonB
MPSPIGGLKAIYSKISYPAIAKKAGIEGKVYVIAYVNENGGVDDVKVLKGIGGGCDEAAIRAVRSTKFTPGKVKGAPVKVKVALPIVFKLKK